MTRNEAEALGRRALAVGWRWSPGALADGPKPGRVQGSTPKLLHIRGHGFWLGDAWPDFRDAATCGILLDQVQEAWDEPHLHCIYQAATGHWCVTFCKGFVAWGGTRAEALVAAWEAKP